MRAAAEAAERQQNHQDQTRARTARIAERDVKAEGPAAESAAGGVRRCSCCRPYRNRDSRCVQGRRRRRQHSTRAGSSSSATMLGPSLRASSGRGCVSRKRPSQPAATAARARYGTMRRSPPLRSPGAAWHLYAVSGVKDHGTAQILHPRDRAHVADQHAVAERGAALGQQQVATADLLHLADDVPHVPGGHELPLLDVDRPAGASGRLQQVGLPGQERRDLQQIAHLRDRPDLAASRECRW